MGKKRGKMEEKGKKRVTLAEVILALKYLV
jgi:hypothetical protein